MLTFDAFVAQLWPSFLFFVGFVVGIFLLSKLLPGRVDLGVPHVNEAGETVQIRYTLNGLSIFLIVAALLVVGIATGQLEVYRVIDNFWGLFFWANVFSWVGSGVLQWWGYRHDRNRAPTGVRVNADGTATATGTSSAVTPMTLLKDYFMGAELNPSLFGVDLKMFSYKPSLIGLFVLNVSFAAVQLHEFHTLSNAMILYQLFTGIYLFNYFHFEYGMVFTWDIIAEKFGWMLVWGDYAFVPFAYSVIGWYLCAVDPAQEHLPAWLVVLCVALFTLGLWIFRGSNEQKDQFKRDPTRAIWGKTPESIQGRILISGFWGIGRKLNYTGEITIYTSWALLTQFVSPVPFILPVWLFCLLTHRAWRDDLKCRAKYGATWDAYCKRARFRMIPFIY